MLNAGLGIAVDEHDIELLVERARRVRGTALTATSVAASGHPGGSLSSAEIFTLLWGCARVRAGEPAWDDRDRIVVSHGHTSPGVYAALAWSGYFDHEQVEAHFRQAGSVFEGHVERAVPGIEWSTGNLGQGLSAGVGLALAARAAGKSWNTFVAMSDGEQHKGQVGEARRLAAKERLSTLTVVVDWNHIQISGRTDDVMPVDLEADWAADGWNVVHADGHDLRGLAEAVRVAVQSPVPTVVLAHTVIGKGVSFMEGKAEFHGRGLTDTEYAQAMQELGLSDALANARATRSGQCSVVPVEHRVTPPALSPGDPRPFSVGEKADCRGAWGKALVDLAVNNPQTPMVVFDCDLAVSVKTDGFASERPQGFIQSGVGEHNVATAAGAASSVPGVSSWWSDFGAFGIDEAYNQQRLNDINGAALKLAVTHCGLDVGEDGKTHQCLDYIGAFRELFGWRLLVPADAAQTDHCVREMASMQGNVALAMGRSKLPIIAAEDGTALFGSTYRLTYGEIVWARSGTDAAILVCGTPSHAAVEAADRLRATGRSVAVGVCVSPLHLDVAQLGCVPGERIITVEDHNRFTGLGATVARLIATGDVRARLYPIGVDDYQSSGAADELYRRAGLDATGIAATVEAAIAG